MGPIGESRKRDEVSRTRSPPPAWSLAASDRGDPRARPPRLGGREARPVAIAHRHSRRRPSASEAQPRPSIAGAASATPGSAAQRPADRLRVGERAPRAGEISGARCAPPSAAGSGPGTPRAAPARRRGRRRPPRGRRSRSSRSGRRAPAAARPPDSGGRRRSRTACRVSGLRLAFRPQQRKQDHVPDGMAVGQQHRRADRCRCPRPPSAACRARGPRRSPRRTAPPPASPRARSSAWRRKRVGLLGRVVQLGEAVGDLHAAGVELEAVGPLRVLRLLPRERRDLGRKLVEEGRLHELRSRRPPRRARREACPSSRGSARASRLRSGRPPGAASPPTRGLPGRLPRAGRPA